MKYFLFLFTVLYAVPFYAQEDTIEVSVVDSLYREDQFYLGLTFNLLGDRPTGVSQNGLSGTLQGGFIRDMPINKRRNKALGLGVGLAASTFNHNLFIGEEVDDQTSIFSVVPNDVGEDINRFSYFSVQVPLQYRWRTSTPTTYGFWRIYGGVNLEYIYHFRSTFEQPGNRVRQTDIPELNRWQYGAHLSFGYGPFNFYGYYSLNTLFSDQAKIEDIAPVNLRVIRLGIMFYIL